METFDNLELKRLAWVAEGPSAFDLREGLNTLAILEWSDAASDHAQGRTVDRAWDLERVSLFGPYVRVSTSETGPEIAHFGTAAVDQPCMAHFPDGVQYAWGPLAVIDGMSFGTPDGQAVVDFRPYADRDDRGAHVTVHEAVPELAVLLLLGFYILEMENRDIYGLSIEKSPVSAL
jgi:hypothetical protein